MPNTSDEKVLQISQNPPNRENSSNVHIWLTNSNTKNRFNA